MRILRRTITFIFLTQSLLLSQSIYDSLATHIITESLQSNNAMQLLTELCTKIGHRISGSPQATKAVEWSKRVMESYAFDNVRTEPVTVPRWFRGNVERATLRVKGQAAIKLNITTLGGSVGTPKQGVSGMVVEILSWDQLKSYGDSAKGKIVFYNRPMERSRRNVFEAYGRAVDQRGRGAVEAAKYGAVGVIVRSMTTRLDDFPHTGGMGYAEGGQKIPAVAVSTNDAEKLSSLLKKHGSANTRVTLELSAQMMPDVESANVVGELRGTEFPDEVIVIGGHLDSWDIGQGAHDDGAGVVQAIEAIRILKALGLKPKRTIRAVSFMNEENGGRGGQAFADKDRGTEKTIAAIESDAGGFMPRGFGIADSNAFRKLKVFEPLFAQIGADRITFGGGGSDITPLARKGASLIGLTVDTQRYFESHHTNNDVLDRVNERELALGAACMAILSYVIAQEGL
jgi:hypothetical protein